MNTFKSEYFEEDNTKTDLLKEDSTNLEDPEEGQENTHLCALCNKRFGSKSNLSTHVNYLHKEKRHPCSQCEYQAPSKENLKRHIQSVHENIKHFCNICD